IDLAIEAGGTFDFSSASDTMGGLSGAGLVTRTAASAGTLTANNGGENTTFSGVIENGAGTVGLTKSSTGTLTLTGVNTFTGTLFVNNGPATAGTYSLVISGASGSVATNTINIGDNNGGNESLRIGAVADVWTNSVLNRVSDTATITLSGTASTNGLAFHGPAATSTGNVETIGTLAVNLGRNYVTLVPGTGNELQVNTGALTRTGNGTLLLRGDNLGGTGTGSTRLLVTGALTLAGSGGADGTVSKSILSWGVGDNTSTGPGSGFLTHDAINGMRLLTAAEYDSTIAGSGATLRNVSAGGGETVTTNEAINSLRITGGTTTIADGVHVRPASGAVLFTVASSIDGAGGFLDFGNTQGIIHVSQNTAAITATINTRIAGTAGLAVGSTGDVNNILVLAGDNTVVGTLVVNSGILRIGSAGALNDNFAMTVNARAGTTVQLFGNNVTLRNLQGSSGTGVYQNGAATAATLTTYLTAAQTLTTVLSNGGTGALNLVVSGNTFTLTLNAANTYTGTTEIRGGAITLSGNNTGHIQSSSAITVYGATLRLTNTSGNVLNNRINNSGTTNLIAGAFDFDNSAASGVAFSEADAGALALVAGANTVTVDRAASGQTSTVTFDSLSRSAGATVNFTSQNNGTAVFDLGTTTQSRLVFTAAPTLDDGILGGWATTNSSATTLEFVKYVSSGTISITALTGADYTAGLASGANATQNVKITATPAALTSNTQINSLNVQQASATTVDLGGNTLRVESGGVIVSGDFNSSFINGNLTAGTGDNTAGELIFHTVGATANPVVVDAVITDNGTGSVSLVKTGAGVLDLQGVTNTYTGKTFINGGILRIDSDANLGAAPVAPSAGHLTMMGGARLDIMQSFTLNANRSIVIGPGVNTINIASGTAGNGKTLTYNGSITNFGTGEGSLTIESNAVVTTGPDVGEFNGTLSALNLGGTFRFEAGAITVNGATSEIGRSLQVAMDGNATLIYAASGGSLDVGQGITEVLEIGVNSSDVLNTTGVLDVSALQTFRADVNTIRLGIGNTGFSGKGTMLLASNNEITAGTSILISNSTGTGQEGVAVQSVIRFGEGVNSVMTPLMTVGGLKGNGLVQMETGGLLKLSGFGQRTMILRIGSNVGNTGTLSSGEMNVANGTLVGDFDTIILGEKSGGGVGGGDGILTLGTSSTNAVETNTLVLGTMAAAAGTAVAKTTSQGELTFGGGSFIVHGDVSMGLFSGTVGTAAGMLNITGGTFTVGGNIVKTDSQRSSG
ncbi:MAG: beta strand repeat-containing protein, partial [Roseimicrobium sp.]